MKIALFSDTYPPRINGVATSVLMLKENFVLMGHDVLVVTCADPNAEEPEPGIVRIPSIPFRTERLATVAGPRVYKDIADFAPDVIHTHAEFTLGILGRAMSLMLKKPHVHTMHTVWEYYTKHLVDIDVFEPAIREAARKYTALVCNQANKVIVPTRKIEDLLRSYKVRKEIVIIPTGIDTDRFAPELCPPDKLSAVRSELGLCDGDRVLLNICRVEKEKNLDELLMMLREYLCAHADVKLVIVGDGTARHELEQLTSELGIDESVIFAGKRPRDEINLYYRTGDVFVSSSMSETQGLTYIEAMASGVPVVAKRDRCLDGVLYEGRNGYMFDDAAGFIEAVDKLLGDAELRLRLSANAIECARRLSSKGYADKVLALYEELVE